MSRNTFVIPLLSIVLVIFSFSASIWLVSSPWWLTIAYRIPLINRSEVLVDSDLNKVALATLKFINGQIDINALEQMSLQGMSAYNQREIEHLEDVYKLKTDSDRVLGISLVLMIILSLISKKPRVFSVSLAAKKSVRLLLLLTGLLIVSIIFLWQYLFVWFHQLLFPAGTWQFSYSDTLIVLFPESFWVASFLATTILTFTLSFLIYWLSKSVLSKLSAYQ